jgi:crotonobetainyl-CoA:carnitine CoA-transferase CaiB-like acyl-CoA transferase
MCVNAFAVVRPGTRWPNSPKVRSIRELSESEWTSYWGAIQEVSDRHGGSYRLPGRPWRFSDEELTALGAPAFQGEHNRSVFEELGLTADEIARHIASGALVSRVPAGKAVS